MILFKAINSSHYPDMCFSSNFNPNFRIDSWENMIAAAYSHVIHDNKKRKELNRDYWLSATNDYEVAYRYLTNKNHNFDGIAVIELPNTLYSGYIYDDTLRTRGYIEKDLNKQVCLWKPNQDGIITVLDMSSIPTIYYLSSYLWLKGNNSTPKSFRAVRSANKDHEFLFLGQNINFKFLDKQTSKRIYQEKKWGLYPTKDLNLDLLLGIIKYAPDSDIKRKVLQERNLEYTSQSDSYEEFLQDEIDYLREIAIENEDYWGDDFIDVDEKDLKSRFYKKRKQEKDFFVNQFYENVSYVYMREKVYKRFKKFPKLEYKDKDVIDFSEYEVVEKFIPLEFSYIIRAYIYSGYNMGAVIKELGLHNLINELYKEFTVPALLGVSIDDCLNFELNFHPKELCLGIYSELFLNQCRGNI